MAEENPCACRREEVWLARSLPQTMPLPPTGRSTRKNQQRHTMDAVGELAVGETRLLQVYGLIWGGGAFQERGVRVEVTAAV